MHCIACNSQKSIGLLSSQSAYMSPKCFPRFTSYNQAAFLTLIATGRAASRDQLTTYHGPHSYVLRFRQLILAYVAQLSLDPLVCRAIHATHAQTLPIPRCEEKSGRSTPPSSYHSTIAVITTSKNITHSGPLRVGDCCSLFMRRQHPG
ncbi:hypothetical protein EVAR_3363_1 [Eumeta japonica]|uniref:Uncharacterized protein n=1 Tax=Eumeta variegata TaxID=151549 RepID=A0A4C1SUW4_EUMVA|nr:hypothetical protein EVAR_3363_1 [Eumeta japonica]